MAFDKEVNKLMISFSIFYRTLAVVAALALLAGPLAVSAAVTQSNDNTGAGSVNVNKIKANVKIKHTTNTSTKLKNNVGVVANTGNNSQTANTSSGALTSGGVSVTVTQTNTLN